MKTAKIITIRLKSNFLMKINLGRHLIKRVNFKLKLKIHQKIHEIKAWCLWVFQINYNSYLRSKFPSSIVAFFIK